MDLGNWIRFSQHFRISFPMCFWMVWAWLGVFRVQGAFVMGLIMKADLLMFSFQVFRVYYKGVQLRCFMV